MGWQRRLGLSRARRSRHSVPSAADAFFVFVPPLLIFGLLVLSGLN
jgi:hypothetical protein